VIIAADTARCWYGLLAGRAGKTAEESKAREPA
jgi:hypothetical protein